MLRFPEKIEKLIESFSQLPGIGRKTAERFVFFLLKKPVADVQKFRENLQAIENANFNCAECFNFSDSDTVCHVCADSQRDRALICVVEKIHDLNVLESTGNYNGIYHVIGGQINPLEGITVESLKIKELVERIKKLNAREVILALNPNMQGEATAVTLKRILEPLNIKITRLARGLPMGAVLEYADEVTLSSALKNRESL